MSLLEVTVAVLLIVGATTALAPALHTIVQLSTEKHESSSLNCRSSTGTPRFLECEDGYQQFIVYP